MKRKKKRFHRENHPRINRDGDLLCSTITIKGNPCPIWPGYIDPRGVGFCHVHAIRRLCRRLPKRRPNSPKNVENAFEAALEHAQSPIEEAMIRALLRGGLSALSQHPVRIEQRSYFIDLAIITDRLKVAVECDGHNWHERTKEQARSDRARERAILRAGWLVIRFTGSEIHRDADRCAMEVRSIIQAYRYAPRSEPP